MNLALQALTKALAGLVLFGLCLFLPAGTFSYPGAWTLLFLLFLPMILLGAVLFWKAPDLLRKRIQMREQEDAQKSVILWSALEFLLCFVVAGLDFRFGWSHLPSWLTVLSCILFLLGYLLYAETLRENAFLSRTVEVQEGQKVVSTGLYGIVRHPMYFSVLLLFWSMPLILDSLPAFLIMLPFFFLLRKRIINEEQVLLKGLDGYEEYRKKVRYRLLPFLW